MAPKAPEPSKKTPGAPKKPPGVNVFRDLASHLSTLTGKVDDKDKSKVILPPAQVHVAGNAAGEPLIRLPGVISTRCETLDAAIGIGGVPMARLTVITGGEGCGKTTIAGHLTAECQAMDGITLYIDNEHKLDLDYFRTLGVDLSKFLLTQPSTIEDSFTILNELIMKVLRDHPGRPILGVLDSLNATKSSKEYEEDGTADFNESNQGGLGASARFMSTNIPKLLRQISQQPVALLFISQPRDNIGTPGRNLIAGGNAPKFYAALAIELWRKGFWEEAGRKIGSITMAKVFKNQVAKPFLEAEVPIRWGIGVDYHKSLLDQAIKQGLVGHSGGWFEMPTDDKPMKWQGIKGWHALTQKQPEVLATLVHKVREGFPNYGATS